MADGFIVGTTKGPTKIEKPQDNYNAIVTHDSLNPEANLSLFQKDSLPTVTIAKTPEDSTELSTGKTNELPRNERAAVLIPVGSSQTTENTEGSGIFPEWVITMHPSIRHNTIETAAEVDISSDGSGMLLETINEKQDKDLLFTTTVHNPGDVDISKLVHHSSGKNGESRMGPEAPTSDLLTTTLTNILEEDVIAVAENRDLKEKGIASFNHYDGSQNMI